MHSLSRTNRMVITGSYYSPLLASRVVSVIRSLTDPASGREVLVVCEVSVNSIFSGFIRKMEPYETLIVLDANDETVYMNAATLPCLQASSQSALLDISDELRGALSALGEGSHELSLSGGARIVQILRGGQGWNLCVLMDANQFYRDVRSVQNIYLLIGALALFALTGVSMLLSRWVLQPVRMLAAQMDGISTSEQAVLSAVTRKDEIGKLQQSFQRLLVRLQLAGVERIRMERRRYELEYKVLQSQIQPHFLFNIHICVDSLLEQNRIDEARRMLGAMDALLRISIDKKEMVSLEEEIGITHMYVTLQQTRAA
jgi:HAMP domain-containing protein